MKVPSWCVAIALAAVAGAGQGKFLDLRAPTGASGPRLYEIRSAVAVGNRTLAAVRVLTSDEKERRSLSYTRGSAVFFAPVWFSRTWKVWQVGERFYVPDYWMSSMSSDLSAGQRDWAPRTFPKVLIRASEEDECPYLFAFPTRLYCLDPELRATARFDLPAVAVDVRVVDGEIWVAAAYRGHLAHRYDRATKEFVEDGVPLAGVLAAVKEAGFSSEETAALREDDREQREAPPFPERETDAPGYRAQRRVWDAFVAPLFTLPRSFQFDLAVNRELVGVMLRKPLGLVVARWPDGRGATFHPVSREDLPLSISAGGWKGLYLVGLEAVGRGSFFALFETQAPVTYHQELVESPEGAAEAARMYREGTGERIPPDAVVGVNVALLGLRFEEHGLEKVTVWSDVVDSKWAIHPVRLSVFAYRPDEAWIPVTYLKNKWVRGIARLQ